jgi:hypothetical protein
MWIPPDPTVVFETYWRFARKRFDIYQKRLAGAPAPWTDDPILQECKFTNSFRVCDRVSQYLLREIIYNPALSADPEEVVFRILLFKLFNKISTWETLVKAFGTPTWNEFNETAYVKVLDGIKAAGAKIFSGAYVHNQIPNYEHVSPFKHPRYIRLLKVMMEDGVTAKLQAARTYEQAFQVLRKYPLHGNFIGMQHLTDLNYSEVINFDEDDFILPGPGALRGIQKCLAFGRTPPVAEAVYVIEGCVEKQEDIFQHFGLEPVTLFGRRLHLIDCQNLFCETDKYARKAHPEYNSDPSEKETRIKNLFHLTGSLPEPFFPPKWRLNPGLLKVA